MIEEDEDLSKNIIFNSDYYDNIYKEISWIENNFLVKTHKEQPELTILTIGEFLGLQLPTNFNFLHKNIAEISRYAIGIFNDDVFNDDDSKDEDDFEEEFNNQENIKRIITIEVFFKENEKAPKLEDGSMAHLWLDTFGENVIPYKGTKEYESDTWKRRLTPLGEYINELENIKKRKKEV